MNSDNTQTTSSEPIRVSIFNQIYNLRSRDNGERIQHIAQLVDERMRQIASHAPTHDVTKIAILAALNIADDLQRMREHYESGQAGLSLSEEVNAGPSEGGEANRQESRQQSWYEDLFESRTDRKNDERLSTLISSKLQMLRQPNQDSVTIEAEEDEN